MSLESGNNGPVDTPPLHSREDRFDGKDNPVDTADTFEYRGCSRMEWKRGGVSLGVDSINSANVEFTDLNVLSFSLETCWIFDPIGSSLSHWFSNFVFPPCRLTAVAIDLVISCVDGNPLKLRST